MYTQNILREEELLMKLAEFIKVYCKDIDTTTTKFKCTHVKRRHDLVEEFGLQYAGWDLNDDGTRIYYIEHQGKKIDVLDFIEFEKETFVNIYEKVDTPEVLGDLYDRYITAIGMISGADAISEIRSQINEATQSIEKYKSMKFRL